MRDEDSVERMEELDELEDGFRFMELDAEVESELNKVLCAVDRKCSREILDGLEVAAGFSVMGMIVLSTGGAVWTSVFTTAISCCMFEVIFCVTVSTIRASKSWRRTPKSVCTSSSLESRSEIR